MLKTQERFLAQFETSVATGIIEFCKALSKVDADIYIVMARKAACFIDSLRKLSLLNLDGYVTTERVLDMDCKWLSGKKIAIIDDAIISGTTINRTLDKLSSLEIKSATVHVLCVNNEWFERRLIECEEDNVLQKPYLQLDDSECIRACSDIVTSISVLPRPYDIDFPYFKYSKITDKEISGIIHFLEWEADELIASSS